MSYEFGPVNGLAIEFFFGEEDDKSLFEHDKKRITDPDAIKNYPYFIIRQFTVHVKPTKGALYGMSNKVIPGETAKEDITPLVQGNMFTGKIDYIMKKTRERQLIKGELGSKDVEVSYYDTVGYYNIEGEFKGARHLHPEDSMFSKQFLTTTASYNSALISFDITKMSSAILVDQKTKAKLSTESDEVKDILPGTTLMYRSVKNPDGKAGQSVSVVQTQKSVMVKDSAGQSKTVIPVNNFALYDGSFRAIKYDRQLYGTIYNLNPDYSGWQSFKHNELSRIDGLISGLQNKNPRTTEEEQALANLTELKTTIINKSNQPISPQAALTIPGQPGSTPLKTASLAKTNSSSSNNFLNFAKSAFARTPVQAVPASPGTQTPVFGTPTASIISPPTAEQQFNSLGNKETPNGVADEPPSNSSSQFVSPGSDMDTLLTATGTGRRKKSGGKKSGKGNGSTLKFLNNKIKKKRQEPKTRRMKFGSKK
jgi:hypothetical protein